MELGERGPGEVLADAHLPSQQAPEVEGAAALPRRLDGLLGEKQPPVGLLLADACAGAKEVTDLRVSAGPNLWDWLGTHLSLGFVRLKTVRITGTMHR